MRAVSPSTLKYLRNAVAQDFPVARPVAQRRTIVCLARPLYQERLQNRWPSRVSARAYASEATAPKPDERTSTSTSHISSQIPKTHYDLFPQTLSAGLPPSGPFPIDLRALRREFLQLQARAHPDSHPEHLKARAHATSSHINEAYKTLQDPLKRAQYLLSLRGIETDKDEAAKLGGDAGGDGELLMTVMEVNETMEEAESEEVIEELRAENEERIEESVTALERKFAEDDLEGARRAAVRLRYWVNIKEGLDQWEQGKGTILVH